jgi:hypothetical protein
MHTAFAVIATDAAGNESAPQSVTLEINNLDEVAPSITSGNTGSAVNENSGAGQVVYTAAATDDADTTDGFSFSLADNSLGFSIDTDGVVTTNADFVADYESAQSQSFTVVATDAAGNASEQVVNVAINNLDEIAPSITSGNTGTAVNENSGAGQIVYTATASDTDFNGAEDITFSLADESLGFSIDSNGVVTTDADFAANFEDAESQSFTVVATDAAGNSSEQVVSIAINNLDEIAPTITSGDTATTIDENSGAGQVVYTATATDDADTSDGFSFSLADESLGFSIDASTGVVTTNDDFAADFEDAQSQTFTVIATDEAGNISAQQVVNVAINNLDEIAPTITSGNTAIAIDENSVADQIIYTATADDSADTSEGVTFSLDDETLGFTINSETGVVTTNADFVADYEDSQSQSFTVVATDEAGNTTEQVVSVAINNLDEIAPTVTSGNTAIAVNENSGADQVIYTATADDSADTSEGVTFSLSSDSDTALTIDSVTGEVTLSTNPDHETQSTYSFAVIATDVAGNASDAQSVTLTINNLDEVAPTITSANTASVLESAGANAVVYRARVDDTSDISEGVTFSLAADSDTALTIDPETGSVTLAGEPNFATKPIYLFTVIATDAAGNESAPESVTLSVVDQDLEAPVFTSAATVSIDENVGENQIVYTAITEDESLVTYSLSEDSDGTLSINSATGEVTLTTDPDYEIQNAYSFAVIATDAAGNESAPQSVTLEINNLDEVAPSITSGNTGSAVNENSGAGQVVYTAAATDDADTTDGFSFSLADNSLGFSIDTDGVVTTNADFVADYESAQSQSFTVVATDAAGNASEQVVNVAINNLDEIAPSITSGNTGTAVNENSGAGQIVYTATASDTDFNGAEDITFSLADESLGFSIDSNGVVTTDADFAANFEDAESQSFTVVATDAAGNSSEQVVSIAINNLDEIAPTITSGDTATTIDENSGAGQVVYTATATDDADTSDGFSFSLADESLGFSIDASTGVVTTNDDFAADFEDAQSQTFTVIATDEAGNISAQQVVNVAINNLDEIAPTITSGNTAIAIDENSVADQIIYTATADDSADTSEGVTFSLDDETLGFTINSETGVVTTNADFVADYEDSQSQSFTVVATDEAGNTTEQVVSVAINNLDEIAPTVTSGNTAIAVNENSGADQVIYTATADDSADISAGVTFSLSSDSDTALTIDSVTGEVTLSTNPDHETQSTYSFAVIARDVAGNTSDAQSVTLTINDLDDTAPAITSASIATAIDENSGAGQIVYTATADDSADVSDTPITFSLAAGSDAAVTIDSETGEVALADNPDYETQSEYSFAVIATDAAGNASVAQSVTLTINNLDDTAPTITSGDTATAIDENSGAGQVIYTATADDSADVSDGVTFSLAEDNVPPKFAINKWNGEVTLLTSPDYEETESLSFTVVATDAAGNESQGQSVTLNINNLDEVPPTITSASAIAVQETYVDQDPDAQSQDLNIFVNEAVYQTTVDDSSDIPTHGATDITYALTDGSDPAINIDANTG